MQRVRILAKQAIDAGAILYSDTKALDVRGDKVTTQNGLIHCSKVIVAIDGKLE